MSILVDNCTEDMYAEMVLVRMKSGIETRNVRFDNKLIGFELHFFGFFINTEPLHGWADVRIVFPPVVSSN